MSIKVEGADRLTAKFNAIPTSVRSEATSELREIGRNLHARSVQEAPMLTGDLRGSGFDEVNTGTNGPELTVGFEGLPYIIVQHEGGWLNLRGRYGPHEIHNYTTPGTGSKFLERPWLENKPIYKRGIASAVERGIRA